MLPADPRRRDDMGVYVHLPWCVRKCPYCDFNSHVAPANLPQQQYVDALRRDLDASAEQLADRAVSSVFFGGGTPSLFDAAAIATILSALKDRLTLRPDAEITLEANPGSAEAGRFAGFCSAGVNRLSLGAQSFSDPALRALGRVHTSAEIYQAWECALSAGIENINVDLMYGLPGQSVADACADVAAALRLGAPHISHYQLTLEPGTRFQRNPPALPDEDALAAMETRCEAALAEAGMQVLVLEAGPELSVERAFGSEPLNSIRRVGAVSSGRQRLAAHRPRGHSCTVPHCRHSSALRQFRRDRLAIRPRLSHARESVERERCAVSPARTHVTRKRAVSPGRSG